MKKRWLWAATLLLVATATTFSATRINLATQVRNILGRSNMPAEVAYEDEANAFTVGGQTITSEAIGVTPLTLKGFAGQTADLLKIQDSAANDLFAVQADGDTTIRNFRDQTFELILDSGDTVDQLTTIRLASRGSIDWSIQKFASGVFSIRQGVASTRRFELNPAGNSLYTSGSVTADHVFRDSAATLRITIHGDSDKISFGAAADASIERTAAGVLDVVSVVDANIGFRIAGAAVSGNVLRGNATNFVSAQLNFSDLAGAATDAQVPNTITLDNLTQITTRNFTAMQGTVTDAQVPDTITLDNITQITTRPITSLSGIAGKSQLPSSVAYEDEVNTFTASLNTFLESGSAITPAASTVLLVQNSTATTTDAGLSIISGTSGSSFLNMGDTASETVGRIEYDNLGNQMVFRTGGVDRALIDLNGLAIDQIRSFAFPQVFVIDTDTAGNDMEFKSQATIKLIIASITRATVDAGGLDVVGTVDATTGFTVSGAALAFVWRGGFWEGAPATGLTTIPLPVADQCSAGISVQRATVAAITKGTGTMTFQITRFSNAGVSQGNIFTANQTYSNTGNNRQDYVANTTTATANDYFRFNIATVNGQADVTFLVEGKCNDV